MDNSPSPALAKLAEALRRHRKLAGITQSELAQRIPCSDKTISALETGRDRPSRQMIVAIEKALGLSPGALVDIFDLLDAEGLPGWMRDWVIEERRSTRLRFFQLATIPGLLQTEEYARAVLNGNEAAVQARLERQAILFGDDAPTLHVVLDEAVLHRGFGGPQVMHNQLKYLTECVSDKLTIQIVPSDTNPHPEGAFVIGTTERNEEVAYIESAVRGIVTSSREDLVRLNAVWETIRSHARSQQESLDFIRRTAEERWT
jgi:transcriptional regulator with XRE-family HTH domain